VQLLKIIHQLSLRSSVVVARDCSCCSLRQLSLGQAFEPPRGLYIFLFAATALCRFSVFIETRVNIGYACARGASSHIFFLLVQSTTMIYCLFEQVMVQEEPSLVKKSLV